MKCKSKEKEKLILKKKRQAKKWPAEKQQAKKHNLFNGVPIEFQKYFELIRSDKELNYGRLRRLFRGLFFRQHFQYDNVFDWTKLMFLEMLETEKETSEAEQNTPHEQQESQ